MLADVLRNIVRLVFGSGADINAGNPMPVSLTGAVGSSHGLCYYGIVTGVPGANQFTIAGLAGLGVGKFNGVNNPYFAFVLRDADGAAAAPQGEQQPLTGYVTATGIFTTTAFTAAVGVGDEILIVSPYLAAMGMLYGERSGALAYMSQCPVGMAASPNTIVCPNLGYFPNDAFNNSHQMVVIRNVNALGAAPEMEMRRITDFVTITDTFTTENFSDNVEANDIVLIIHNSVAAQISVYGIADAGSGVGIVRDAARTEANDWWNGQTIMMLSGAARGQKRPIADFVAATDDIIPAPNFDAAVAAGDLYVILAHYNPIVPRTADGVANALTSEVVGRKDDTAITAKDNVSSQVRYLKGLMDIVDYEGATSLADKLTAARAALLDQITALRLAELDAANLPADVDTLLARLTAVRAGYLDELAAANIPTDIDELIASKDRQLFKVPQPNSTITAQIQLTTVAGNKSLGSITVAGIPAGVVITHVFTHVKFSDRENTNAAANSVSGAQNIRANKDGGAYSTGIALGGGEYATPGASAYGGDVMGPTANLVALAPVNGSVIGFQWTSAVSAQNNFNFNNVQVILEIWYSV